MKLILCLLTLMTSFASIAGFIDYNYDYSANNDCDNRCYYDINKTVLSDGVRGTGIAQYNASNGWVGWRDEETVAIDFSFGQSTIINSISLGFLSDRRSGELSAALLTDDHSSWVSAPTFHFSQNQTGNNEYSLSYVTQPIDSMRLVLSSTDKWVLLDEVTFNGTIFVPEPEFSYIFSVALLLLFIRRYISN